MAKICNACARSWIFSRGYGRDILALNNVHIFCQHTVYSIYIHINNSTRKMTMRQTSSWNQKANYKYLRQQKRIPQSNNPENPPYTQVPFRGDHISHRHPTYSHRSPGRVHPLHQVTRAPTPWLCDSPTALASRPSSCISSQALEDKWHFCRLKWWGRSRRWKKNNKKANIPPPTKKKRDQKGARCILQKLKTSNHSNELNRKQNLSAVPVALAQYFQLGHRPGVVHWLLQFYRFLWAWGHS